MQGKFALFFVILCFGISSLLAQETAAWKTRPQIRSSELFFDFTQKGQFEVEKDILFSDKGIKIAASEQAATLISKKTEVPLQSPEPFLTVGSIWTIEAADNGDLILSLRGSRDGKSWGKWLKITPNAHAPNQPGKFFGNLLFLEKETRFIQYRVNLAPSNQSLSPTLKNIRFIFSSPGKTPKEILDKIKQQSKEKRLEKGQAIYQKPPITSRTTWGCPQGQNSPAWTPQYTAVSHLIVHHTATSNTSGNWPAVVRSIWNYHTFTLGWGDIGYNFLIDPGGFIYEGRAGGNDVIGAHFSCANSNTMGIGMIGTFTSVNPTASALANLEELLAWKGDDSSIDPLGTAFHNPTQLNLLNISGHRDANPSPSPTACPSGTVCPGNNLYGQLPTIRNDVDDLLSTPPAYATLPYYTGFESGAFDPFWTTSSSTSTGRFRILQHEFAHSGSFLLVMDNFPSGIFNLNEANLHLDLSASTNVDLSFWWVDAEDESHSQDGVFFSDDGGDNFVKVYHLNGVRSWQLANLDVSQLAAANGLNLTSTFVIKFQQYDDQQIPFDGFAFDEINVTESGAVAKASPDFDFGLEANYPNPFNPLTTINYRIANEGPVTLRIYNLKGQLVRTLVEQVHVAGRHTVQWDSANGKGIPAPSGNYFYELKAGKFREVKRMTLLK